MAFGLYVHWPFCESKCPYCDFNSHIAGHVDAGVWATALTQEIRRTAERVPDEILQTIFFGGGTPSLMPPEVLGIVVETATEVWRSANDIEISMEANPGSVETNRFAAYRQAGVNRVSLGIQALDDDDLRKLGRMHDRADALRAIDIAQETFDRVSIDLIYARQHQELGQWETELSEAISLGTSHLSLYQLTIEDGTVFARRHSAGQLRGLPGEDLSADMFELTQEICEQAGLPAYEISNHAQAGNECRHNLIYWQGGRYAGIGPGAHGRLRQGKHRIATEAIRAPSAWLAAVGQQGSGELPSVTLSHDDIREETLMMGLRLREGIPLTRLEALGINIARCKAIDDLPGLLSIQNGYLKTTDQGRLLLNHVIAKLVDGLPPVQP